MEIRHSLFVLLLFGTLSNGSAQALNKKGQTVPIITSQQATEVADNSLKKGITAQQERDIINNNLKLEMPAGATEGHILKILGGIAVWVDAIKTKTFYEDTDRDGYVSINSTTDAISAPNGYVANSTDCNDGDRAINPATT
jgi:phosphatidate phosphatase APP1